MGLDVLRSIAIWCIIIFHFDGFNISNLMFAKIKGSLWFGVDLFFVLSGFLISSHWFNDLKNNTLSFRNFWIKRFFRILPNYYLILIILIIIQLLKKQSFPFWEYFIFIQNFSDLNFFSPSWSLCVEEHFYLMFPFLSYIFCKKMKNGALIFFLSMPFFSLIVRLFLFHNHGFPVDSHELEKVYYYPTYSRLDGLFVGVLIGYLYTYNNDFYKKLSQYRKSMLGIALSLFAITWSITINRYSYANQIYGYLLLAITSGFFLIALKEVEFKYSFIFNVTAKLSYFMYLIHQLVQYVIVVALMKLNLKLGVLPYFIFYITCMYTIAYLNYLYYETPFYKWGVNKFYKRIP